MRDIVIHPVSQALLKKQNEDMPQSLLMFGPEGVGLLTLAHMIVGSQLLAIVQPQKSPTQSITTPGTITVEMIRSLYEQTRSKHVVRQFIIIDDADQMSHSAQSAFLKLLEEPGDYIHFILTSHQPYSLLPTIRSRVQSIAIHPATREQSRDLITTLGVTDETKRVKLQYIAEGLPAELTRLIADEAHFQTRATAMSDARDLLSADTYSKLLVIHKYKTNRIAATQLIDSALHIVRHSMSTKPHQTLAVKLEQLLTIRERITSNHNIALQLMAFVL